MCWRLWIAKSEQALLDSPEMQRELHVNKLKRQLVAAGDRRDWDECNRLESAIYNLTANP